MSPGHVVPIRVYAAVFIALIALTALTTAASFVNLHGNWNVALALTIAICKASLVFLYFMHLRYSGSLVWMFGAAGLFWLVILMALTLNDVLTRGGLPTLGR